MAAGAAGMDGVMGAVLEEGFGHLRPSAVAGAKEQRHWRPFHVGDAGASGVAGPRRRRSAGWKGATGVT